MITIFQVIYNNNFLFNSSDQNIQAILSLHPLRPSQLQNQTVISNIKDLSSNHLAIIWYNNNCPSNCIISTLFQPVYMTFGSSRKYFFSIVPIQLLLVNYSTTSNGNSLLVPVDSAIAILVLSNIVSIIIPFYHLILPPRPQMNFLENQFYQLKISLLQHQEEQDKCQQGYLVPPQGKLDKRKIQFEEQKELLQLQ
ncbi:hypothetical protein ACTA71_003367 [Dictyostelium dimigraforme]